MRSPWAVSLRSCSPATRGRTCCSAAPTRRWPIGLLIIGALRQRELEHAMRTGEHRPLSFRAVGVFTIGGIVLALTTVVLVIAQT